MGCPWCKQRLKLRGAPRSLAHLPLQAARRSTSMNSSFCSFAHLPLLPARRSTSMSASFSQTSRSVEWTKKSLNENGSGVLRQEYLVAMAVSRQALGFDRARLHQAQRQWVDDECSCKCDIGARAGAFASADEFCHCSDA